MVTTESVLKAVGEVKATKKRNFLQSIDLVVNLRNLDMNKPENRIDQEVLLPSGRGKSVKIALFADGELAHQAKKVVDTVIEKDAVSDIAKDKTIGKKLASEHNFFLSQTDMMALIGKSLGPVLGPRGKMPKPVPPTIDIKPLVERLRRTVRIRTKDRLTFHLPVGTEEMTDDDLAKNIAAVINSLETKLGGSTHNIRSVLIKKSMGPCVKVEGV
ncbi:MAG TPA: 50S ribosomal protein L1 [Euryarchaeota archaeon]|nr:50S ribosomal protein L1 [archaeon BMS3Abin16]GBE57092.1 50S ribosomal protein L1 [archaeon BMS3Bbin16]HDH28378.1 50S ribosomal protein L1 [Euryarchaeota archaeon]HDY74847.1 50S ribosomal protein L1 [Euryarchaeota archaeon]